MAGHGSIKVILGSLAANLGIAIAKFAAAAVTGSGSMQAEAVHSLADCANQILLLIGTKEAEAPPTPEHPLGRGKAAYFWSFLVALMIFAGGGIFSIVEGLHKIEHPEPLSSPLVAYAVLCIAIGVEGLAAWQAYEALDEKRGKVPMWRYLSQTKDIDLVVLFAENTAAVMGLFLALVFLSISLVTGDPVYDAYGSIAIGGLLCVVAVWLAREVKSLLQGEAADPAVEALFHTAAAEQEGIEDVITVLTVQQGPGKVMLAAKVRMTESLDAVGVAEAINALEARVSDAHPHVLWQFVEPDIRD